MDQLNLFDSRLEAEVRRCRLVICFREIEKMNGNYCKAACELGIHRNTLTRIMKASGWGKKAVGKLIRQRKLNDKSSLPSNSNGGSNVLHTMRVSVGRIGPRASDMPSEESVRGVRNGTTAL